MLIEEIWKLFGILVSIVLRMRVQNLAFGTCHFWKGPPKSKATPGSGSDLCRARLLSTVLSCHRLGVGQRVLQFYLEGIWSGRRGSNPRPPPWQGGALPLSYFRPLVRPRATDDPPNARAAGGTRRKHRAGLVAAPVRSCARPCCSGSTIEADVLMAVNLAACGGEYGPPYLTSSSMRRRRPRRPAG